MESELLKLNDQRSAMEQEMSSIVEILESMNGAPGLKEPLVDYEGFPRADVDIFEVRKLRNRHACLQTDHCKLMKDLEQKLYSLHSDYKERGCVDKEEAPKSSKVEQPDAIMEVKEEKKQESIPFVWVHDVAPGSPAQQDGFKIGDAIVSFGQADHTFGDQALNKVVDTVKQNLNNPVTVNLLRKNIVMGTI